MRRLVLVLVVAGCHSEPSKLDDHFAPKSITEPTTGPAAVPPASAAPTGGDQITGTVVETMPASTYTYARLDQGGRDVWIAGPETKLVVGAKIGPVRGTLMTAFHSDTLNRTFDQIYFVDTFGQPVPPTHGAAPAQASATATAPALGGTVVETMDAGGYTYALLDAGGGKTWVAGPPTKLAVGAKLAGMSGTLMTGFHSSTLKRTFDEIYFVNAYAIASPAAASASPTPAAPAPPERVEPIARAPGGKTVAEVFAGRRELEGKLVDVRGKVVKVTSGVLDRNWLHLRDGSGAAGTNDLIVTTAEVVNPGDVVIVHGKIGTNRDLGAGYHYDVLIENATVTR